MKSDVVLRETLLALAEDANHRGLRRAAARLADEAVQGYDLDAALARLDVSLPMHLRAVSGEARLNQATALLAGLMEHETTRRKLRRQLRSVLLYPAIVVVMLVLIMAGGMMFLVPTLEKVYGDFGLTLPEATRAIIAVSHVAPWILLGMLLAPLAYSLLIQLPSLCRVMHWIRTGLPLIGRVWIWNAHHEFASILGALTAQRVVLADALQSTVASLHDANLARAARIAAAKCEAGAPLSRSLADSIHFDRTLTALVAWGETNDALPDALKQAADVYQDELTLHAGFLRRIMPPLLFAAVISFVMFVVVGLMIPLVDLINNLSM
jgi:type II secretory pathway component PulF